MQPSEFFVLSVLTAWAVTFVLRSGRREQGLPPGEPPPTIPLLGNAHMLGYDKRLYMKFTEWARHYGDIFSIKMGSRTMIVLSSPAAIKQVVDKHGWMGSSRPTNYIAELCGTGGEFNILFTPDCEPTHDPLAPSPGTAAESTLLLHDLMAHPEDFVSSIRRYSHSIVKIITYGQRAQSFHGADVQEFFTSLDQLTHALAPGTYPPFDFLPLLKYLPSPLAPWRPVARRVESVRTKIHTGMYDDVRRRQAAGDPKSTECFIGHLIRAGVPKGEEHFYSYTGLSLLDAGSDTTASFLLSLVLVLAVYPECQKRARKEIDAVVGAARLPTLEDFSHVPYVNALIKEILRFSPQLPMAIPHLMTGDAVYKEYLVPKGSVVVLNTYGLCHDPEFFENAEAFNPDRFLESEHGTRPGKDVDFRESLVFGGGRRICPGQWVARSTMQLTTMRLIWALKFTDACDPMTGDPISRELDFYANDFVVMPRPFKCKIEPRSVEHRDLVAQTLDEAKLHLSHYEG
ncbi:cytochrome P450 [Mycena leptocephala]|nr:cytochrome P450 [Mycena leptocephala]